MLFLLSQNKNKIFTLSSNIVANWYVMLKNYVSASIKYFAYRTMIGYAIDFMSRIIDQFTIGEVPRIAVISKIVKIAHWFVMNVFFTVLI